MEPKKESVWEEGRDRGNGRRSGERGRPGIRGGGGAPRQFRGGESRDSRGQEWDRGICGSGESSSGVSSKVETGSADGVDKKVSVYYD